MEKEIEQKAKKKIRDNGKMSIEKFQRQEKIKTVNDKLARNCIVSRYKIKHNLVYKTFG